MFSCSGRWTPGNLLHCLVGNWARPAPQSCWGHGLTAPGVYQVSHLYTHTHAPEVWSKFKQTDHCKMDGSSDLLDTTLVNRHCFVSSKYSMSVLKQVAFGLSNEIHWVLDTKLREGIQNSPQLQGIPYQMFQTLQCLLAVLTVLEIRNCPNY